MAYVATHWVCHCSPWPRPSSHAAGAARSAPQPLSSPRRTLQGVGRGSVLEVYQPAGRSPRTLSVAASIAYPSTTLSCGALTLRVACTARRLATRPRTARGLGGGRILPAVAVGLFVAQIRIQMRRWLDTSYMPFTRPRLLPRCPRLHAPLDAPTPARHRSARPRRFRGHAVRKLTFRGRTTLRLRQ